MITLIGHGYIGDHIAKELSSQFCNFEWISHLDPVNTDTKVIINAAGYTGSPNVDACEIYKQETINGNVIFPIELEKSYPNIPILHISSGCIYTGYKDGGWTEEDDPNFDFNNGSFYSGSKVLGQKLLKPFMDKSYLFRIRMPFGDDPHPKNILTKLEKYDKLIDYENSLSYTIDIARIAVYFANTLPPFGVYNICNPGSKTTKSISNQLEIHKEWFTEDEFKSVTKAPRSNCVLNTNKIQSVYPIQNIDQALNLAIENYKMKR